MGISYTSVENARLNRETEAKEMTFDKAKRLNETAWQEMLGRIDVRFAKGGELKVSLSPEPKDDY